MPKTKPISGIHRVNAVNAAYAEIVAVLLKLKAEGNTPDVLADAIVRAAYQTGIDQIR